MAGGKKTYEMFFGEISGPLNLTKSIKLTKQ